MCGLVGWFQRNGRSVEVSILDAMNRRLAHRGPDGAGIWLDGPIGLGHRRLAIRDLSDQGHQPLSDTSGLVTISYNGEIYNDAALRQELARDHGVVFRSTCDAETIPYAYLAWGEAAFDRLEGMFAIALWDSRSQTLHLARDGIGIKPLYYAETGSTMLFASEVKALFAHPAIKQNLDPDGLHSFLATGHAGPDASIYKDIRQVPPGTVLSYTAAKSRCRVFWQPRRTPELLHMDWAVEALRTTLADVVESQIIADVPLGVLQSGGIDSTIVTLTASRLARETPIFTGAFSDKTYDETEAAAEVAQVAGQPHHILAMDGKVDVEAVMRAVAYHVDGQCADPGLIAFFRLSEGVSRHTKVVLSGDGGDEFFGGYSTYAATALAARLDYPFIKPMAVTAGSMLGRAFAGDERRLPKSALLARFLLGLGADDAPPHLQWRRLVPRPMLSGLYGPSMGHLASESPYQAYRLAFDEQDGDLLDKALVADQRYHLQSVLMKVDTMSMAHGLEVRVPLLDRRIMDLAGRLPLALLAPGSPGKLVLRRLASRLGAPPAITSGGKKGFNVPLATLMRRDLTPMGHWLLDRNADIFAPFLRADAVRRLWRQHTDRRADHAFALWPLFVLGTYLVQLKAEDVPAGSVAEVSARAA